MDDYIRALLLGQLSGVEGQPEQLRDSLEKQEWEASGEAAGQQETFGEEAIAGSPERSELPEAEQERTAAGELWEEKITALEETAGKQFLRRLEREIASLETTERTSLILRQQEMETAGEAREEVRIVGQMAAGEQITPERLSRVFERDARRFQ